MENLRGPNRGEAIIAEGSTGHEVPEGPTRVGPTLKRPDRLEEGDFVVAVSRAVLRELEGGTIREQLQNAIAGNKARPAGHQYDAHHRLRSRSTIFGIWARGKSK